jgi:hypothetical protein
VWFPKTFTVLAANLFSRVAPVRAVLCLCRTELSVIVSVAGHRLGCSEILSLFHFGDRMTQLSLLSQARNKIQEKDLSGVPRHQTRPGWDVLKISFNETFLKLLFDCAA